MSRGIKLPEGPDEWGFKGENYLLTIGIDKYHEWSPLHNAVKDIRDITRLLVDRYQFEADHIISLFDNEATEDNIRRTLLDVKKRITPDDNLIVYYSGHGHYDADLDEGYWVPANARKDSTSDYISNSDVLKWIRAIKTHHTLIIVDSCFSGTLVSQSRSTVLSEKYPSCRIFASGRKELVDDGAPGTNSPFARAILSRLTFNTDRVLRASDLIQAVTKVVEADAGQAPIEGRIKEAGDEGGEFVFHLKVTEDEIWASVVAANTPEEYLRYLDYYPDGKYALEARNTHSALTDETDWNRALTLNTPAALIAYLEAHPRGKYYQEAFRNLEEREEQEAWESAKTRNTVTAYMEYLHKYPEGRYAMLARRGFDALKGGMQKSEQQQVQEALDEIDTTSGDTVDNKSRFKQLLNDAEGLFAQMAYASCIDKYKAALALYEQHYVPDRKFIEQRIHEATTHIQYLEFLEDGKKAATDGNYTLALQYFRKARDIDDSVKVREWITHVEQKLKGDHTFQTSDTPKQRAAQQIPVRKKKSNALAWVLGIAVVSIIGLAGYAIVSALSEPDPYYNSGEIYPEYQADAIAESQPVYEEVKKPAQPPPQQRASVRNMIPGTWKVADLNLAGIPMGAQNASWVFVADGNVTFWENNLYYNGTWSFTQQGEAWECLVFVPTLGLEGRVTFVDRINMNMVAQQLLAQSTMTLVRVQ